MRPGIKICSFILALLCLLSVCGCTVGDNNEYRITVMLSVPSGIDIEGGATRSILPGESASFKITLMTGYEVIDTPEDGYTYEDGVITLDPLYYPTTVNLLVSFDPDSWSGGDEDALEYSFSYTAVGLSGTVSSETQPGILETGTEVTVSAHPYESRKFVCWTLGASLVDGGIIVSSDRDYSFNIDKNTSLFANFGTMGSMTVIYDGNGGVTDGGNRYMRQDTKLDFFLCPHVIVNEGQLTREGHQLYAFNTKPDGSGKEYTFGSNIVMPEDDTIVLYAMWQEIDESVFTTSLKGDDKIAITACSASTETVVIPERIDGRLVTDIDAGAFSNMPNLTTLYLPTGIERIEVAAINKCPKLKTVYMFDKITYMTDNSINSCQAFTTVKIGAARAPTYSTTRNGTYHIKFQRLITAPDNKLVIVGGSSSYYGTDSAMIEDIIGGDYHIVNYGTNQETPSVLFVDIVTDFMDEDDVLLLVPEPNRKQYGGNEMTLIGWQLFEGAFEAFSYLDVSIMSGFFSTFATFNNTRNNMEPKKYTQYSKKATKCEMNTYGDCDFYREQNTPGWNYGKNASFTNTNPTTADYNRLNKAIADLKAKGAHVYLSFSTYNIDGLNTQNKSDTTLNNYAQKIKNNVNATIISGVKDYMYTGEYYYDTNKHLTTLGTRLRSEDLGKKLKAQMEADGLLGQ